MKPLAALALGLAGVALAGCLDLEEEYTLNADGSGKVVLHSVFPPTFFDLGEKKGTPEETMKKAVREELQKARGVDAWTDVSAKLRDDGKVDFRGTAYFKDYSKLKFHNQGASGPMTGLTLTAQAGGWILEAKPESKGAATPPGEPLKLTDEEIQNRIKAERAKYQQMKPLMESFLKESRFRITMHLPGTVSEISILEKPGPSAIALDVAGKKLLEALDALLMDEAWMTNLIKTGQGIDKSEPDPDHLFEKMFGKKGPARAVVRGPLKNLFDYEAQAAPARAKLEETLSAWGVKPPAPPAEAAKGAGIKSVKVAGIQIVHFKDDERELRPLSGEEGTKLALIAELPGSVLSLKDVKVTEAKADTGEDLLPEREFDREVHFPHLSKDRTAALLEVKIKTPSARSRGIRQVRGVLTYLTAGNTKGIDLGLDEIKAGVRGKALGTSIEKIENHFFEKDQKVVTIHFELAREMIESVTLFDAAGKKLDAKAEGYSSSGESCSLSFAVRGELPAKGKVVASVYDGVKAYEVPFAIENVDLLGRPLK